MKNKRLPRYCIQLKQVSKVFDGKTVLKPFDLNVLPGESIVIVGPSGQGKSVLLKILCGLMEPSSGKVYIEGQDLWAIPEKQRVVLAQRMGILFQKNALFDSMTVADNVAFPLRETTKLSEAEITRKVEWFLKAVELDHAAQLFPDEISGGMQKRLGIARALALRPEIVFYDDPTAGLDPITSRVIVRLILDLQKEIQSTIFSVTNDMNRAYQLAGRILMVSQGEVIVSGSKEETQNHPDLRVQQFITGRLDGPLNSEAKPA